MIVKIAISLAIIFIILGALIDAITATSIIRLKGVYSRSHVVGKPATLGVVFLLFGTFLYFIGTGGYTNMRLVLGIIFILIIGPLSSHLMMKASYNNKMPYTKDTKIDELKNEFNNKKI